MAAASSFAFYGLNFRRQMQVLLIIFVLILAACVNDSGVFYGYLTFLVFLLLTLLVDYLFLSEGSFKYDPDYKNWQRQVERR